MLVNKKIEDEFREFAGEERYLRAEKYQKQNKVTINELNYKNENNFSVKAEVKGNYDDYNVYINVEAGEIDDATCECEDYYNHYGACKHIIATILELNKNNMYEKNIYGSGKIRKKDLKYNNFKEILNEFLRKYCK